MNDDHKKIKELIAASFDGEMNAEEKRMVAEHIESCVSCRKAYEERSRFEEVMNKMELQKPSRDTWKYYWDSIYNRLERRIGWILFSVGVMILLFFGGYKGIEGLIQDPGTPLLLKVGILTILSGIVILLVSIFREQIFVRKRERYKEVEK